MAKMRTNTRISTEALEQIVEDATTACRIAREAIASQFPRLTTEDRAAALRPSTAFPKTARKALGSADEFEDLMQVGGVSAEAIREDIDNLEFLYPLQRETDLLKAVTDDAVLLSGDEAYRAMLTLYSIAKVVAANRPEAQELVQMIGGLFSSVRSKAEANPPTE